MNNQYITMGWDHTHPKYIFIYYSHYFQKTLFLSDDYMSQVMDIRLNPHNKIRITNTKSIKYNSIHILFNKIIFYGKEGKDYFVTRLRGI